MSVLEINGLYYALAVDKAGKPKIRQTYVARQSDPFRTQGIQARADDPSINRFVHSAFPLGIGWDEMNRETGRGVGGLKDATVWTHNHFITPSGLHETQTTGAPVDHLRKQVNFRGDFWGVFEENYDSGAITNTVSRKFGATSDDWTGGGTIGTGGVNAVGIRVFDEVVHGENIFVLTSGVPVTGSNTSAADEVVYGCGKSVDGATFVTAAGTGFPDTAATHDYLTTTVTRRNNHTDDMGKLLSFGVNLLAAIWRDPDATNGDGLIEVLKSTDSGANWSSVVTIPSGHGPKAFLDWFDLDGVRAPVLVTSEGVYSIDLTNSVADLIHELDGAPENGRWCKVASNGSLYVGLSTGKVRSLSITNTGILNSFISGPAGDGLVSARQGHVNFMQPVDEWMMVAYGGHAADKNASIFMIDTQTVLRDVTTGKEYNPWHHMYQHGTANVDIIAVSYSTEDDSTPRLHFAVEGASASVLYHIEEPLANPKQSSTVQYQSSGILRLPTDDLGDPQTTASIYKALVDADDLTAGSSGSGGASDEYITLQYGLDGAVDTTTSLGDFLSGQKTQTFETGVGFADARAAKKIAIRLTFNRSSTTTNAPKLGEFELQAHHILLGKRAWDFTLDLESSPNPSTIAAGEQRTEVMITNLEAVATATTLVTFTTGRQAQTRVRAPNEAPPDFDLWVVDSKDENTGYRTGFVKMRLEEAI